MDWNAGLRQYLTIGAGPDASLGALLSALGNACQASVEQWIGRTFDVQEYTEVRNGNDRRAMYTLWDPIVSVTSLTVNGTAMAVMNPAAPTYPPPAAVIANEADHILLTNGATFPCGVSNVQIVYSAGLGSADGGGPPNDLVFAVSYWAGMLFKDRDRLGLGSVTMREQVTSFVRVLPPPVVQMVSRWRRTMRPSI